MLGCYVEVLRSVADLDPRLKNYNIPIIVNFLYWQLLKNHVHMFAYFQFMNTVFTQTFFSLKKVVTKFI
jgi:hypothetical protein